MAYYYTCPHCGANLDPGETCDCRSEEVRVRKEKERQFREAMELIKQDKNGQLSLIV